MTPQAIADAAGRKPFEIIKVLIGLEVFVAPTQCIEDEIVHAVGDVLGVTIVIDEDDDGGGSVRRVRPVSPDPSLSRRERVYLAKLLEEQEPGDG